jgi:hypothetical protein
MSMSQLREQFVSEMCSVTLPNRRFLLDAFRSPLRATHRAAKPER